MPSSFSYAAASGRAPLSGDDDVALLARRIPKAELHTHHMGAQSPSEFARLSGVRPPSAVRASYDNLGAAKFFDDLDRAVALWPDASSITSGVVRILAAAFDHGVRHLELLCTPSLNEQQVGVPAADVLRAIGDGFAIAADGFGMSGGIVVDVHRYDGADAALELVHSTIGLGAEGVPILGYGSDGDHRTVPLDALAPAFVVARDAGYRLTAHVDSIDDVRTALDLGLDRIDHGWIAAADRSVLERIAEAGVPLTFCPMAYVITRRPSRLDWVDALRILLDAGVPVVIGTDDPALHHTDLAHSYDLVARRLGWDSAQLAASARTSFDHAWLPDGDRAAMLGAWNDEITALEGDARGPLPAG